MFAGGTEAAVSPAAVAGFAAMKAMSHAMMSQQRRPVHLTVTVMVS